MGHFSKYVAILAVTTLLLLSGTQPAFAAAGLVPDSSAIFGYAALAIFVLSYVLVILEETIHLRKSKSVMVAAGFIWMLVALAWQDTPRAHEVSEMFRHNLLEYAELLLFLLAAMTFINTLEERNIFQAIRARLVSAGFSLPAIFWITGLMAFFISPFADNLTTALVMGAVALTVGAGHPVFISVACINIVVAANSGGAFSPFGDITTLMVWQKGKVAFFDFFVLFLPSFASWFVPAFFMSFAVPRLKPTAQDGHVMVKQGGYVVTALFFGTIAMTVALHQFLHLPPVIGMMTGLGLLKLYGYFIRQSELRAWAPLPQAAHGDYKPSKKPFDVFISMKRVEWDTLMFFYGIILSVGGLGALGYLAALSNFLYVGLGPTEANILMGLLSAVIDNIPIMFAVLNMDPAMSEGQWLLVTLTAGIGGSLLSIGSAAGVALMGQARGIYTFMSHLKWTWAVALGYAAGVWLHIALNGL